jgi:hypothetical protein
MSWVWAILGCLVALLVGVFGGGYAGVRLERAKTAKKQAEKQRDRALEVDHVDAETMAKHDLVRRIPDPGDRLKAASAATADAVERWKRRRDD